MSPTPYVKQTWSDGSSSFPLSAARLGVIENGVFDAHYRPVCRAYNTTTQTFTTGVAAVVTLDSERFDTDNMHSTTVNTSRITANTAGYYQITAQMQWAASAVASNRQLSIKLNATTQISLDLKVLPAVSQSFTHVISTLYLLAVNDFIEMEAIQTTGGNLANVAAGNYTPELMAALVSY